MASIKYDFNKPLLEWDGKPAKDDKNEVLNLAKHLAKTIFYSAVSNTDVVMKYFAWGTDLNTSGVLNLDKEDRNKLHEFILSNPTLPVITKGQLITVLEETKK